MIIDGVYIDYESINEKLRPCPFCGGKIVVCSYKYESSANYTEMEAGCNRCGTNFHMFGSDYSFAKSAMELWNTRISKE